jgi:hypothetical protein
MSLFAEPLNILTKQQAFKDNVFTRLVIVKLIWSILTQVFQIPASVFYYFRYKSDMDCAKENFDNLRQVSEYAQRDNPHICIAAVQRNGGALRYVPESLKTNVDALAKLYTISQEQLRADLLSLEINDDVINQVICSLKAPIATSSSMIEQLLGTGNDSKQPAEKAVESRDVICAALLPIIEGYVYTPSNQENDAKERKVFTP